MTVIPSIPTQYGKQKFRSRLEAKWALFFDLMKIEWVYEPEQYKLGENGDIWYTPDFWLPNYGVFAEAKPKDFGNYEKYKCALLAEEIKHSCLLLSGSPNFQSYQIVDGIESETEDTFVPKERTVVLAYRDAPLSSATNRKSPSDYGPDYVDAVLQCRGTKFETEDSSRCVALTANGERCNCQLENNSLCTNHLAKIWRNISAMEKEFSVERKRWAMAIVGDVKTVVGNRTFVVLKSPFRRRNLWSEIQSDNALFTDTESASYRAKELFPNKPSV